MKLARIRWDQGPEFAVRAGEEPWVPLSSMGVMAADTAEAIHQRKAIDVALDAGRGTSVIGEVELLCPVVRPGKIMAIGLNYMDHIREAGAVAPERPVVFAKFPSALIGPFDPIAVDLGVTQMPDYESELAVVIGKPVRKISEQEALSAVFGYCVGNDVSARDLQAQDPQLSRSKSLDTFCPMGPWITTSDEVLDPQALRIGSKVNGERRQDSSTKEMVFSVAQLIRYLAEGMTLEPGDVILTGTPHGVGFAMKPPVFLQPGDTVVCEVEVLGRIENQVLSC